MDPVCTPLSFSKWPKKSGTGWQAGRRYIRQVPTGKPQSQAGPSRQAPVSGRPQQLPHKAGISLTSRKYSLTLAALPECGMRAITLSAGHMIPRNSGREKETYLRQRWRGKGVEGTNSLYSPTHTNTLNTLTQH